MFVHPFFLLWSAQAYPQDVGCGFVDLQSDLSFFFGCERAERRCVGSGDDDSVTLMQLLGKILGYAGRAAVEKVPIAAASFLAELLHQFGAGNPVAQWKTVEAAEPDERHAVGNNEIGGVQNFSKMEIAARFGNAVHASDGDITAGLAAGNEALHAVDRGGHLHCVHAHTENMEHRILQVAVAGLQRQA